MNKKELISSISEVSGLSKADSARAVNAFSSVVRASLRSGDKVALAGFGRFEARSRTARTIKNLKTGETINIPPRRVPAFKACEDFMKNPE
jgi:DNA-binding protein HU-beta